MLVGHNLSGCTGCHRTGWTKCWHHFTLGAAGLSSLPDDLSVGGSLDLRAAQD